MKNEIPLSSTEMLIMVQDAKCRIEELELLEMRIGWKRWIQEEIFEKVDLVRSLQRQLKADDSSILRTKSFPNPATFKNWFMDKVEFIILSRCFTDNSGNYAIEYYDR